MIWIYARSDRTPVIKRKKGHMEDLVIAAFQKHPMFEGISIDNCSTLMNCLGCVIKSYKRDQIIPSSEIEAKQIGIVIRGCVHSIQEDIWGRRAFLSYTGSDGIFGISMLGDAFEDRGFIFKASEPTTVLYLPADRILHPCKNSCPFHHHLSRNLFKLVSRKNVVLTQKIEITSKSSLREKILAYLSMEAQKSGSMIFTIPLGRSEMADYLCTNRSALSRELSKMKKDGILDYDQRTFHLFNTNYE